MTEPSRWIAEIVDRTGPGPAGVAHDSSELDELHDAVEDAVKP